MKKVIIALNKVIGTLITVVLVGICVTGYILSPRKFEK